VKICVKCGVRPATPKTVYCEKCNRKRSAAEYTKPLNMHTGELPPIIRRGRVSLSPPPVMTITETTAAARDAGMSYGQYVARYGGAYK